MENPSTSLPPPLTPLWSTRPHRPSCSLPSGWWVSVLIVFCLGIVNWPDAFFPFFTFHNPGEFEIHADSLSQIFFFARFCPPSAVQFSSHSIIYIHIVSHTHTLYCYIFPTALANVSSFYLFLIRGSTEFFAWGLQRGRGNCFLSN